MKSQDDERKLLQQLPDDREQIRLADLFAGGDKLELGHTVHRIDVIHPFLPVQIALMHTVNADVAWRSLRLWGAALSNGDPGRARLRPMPPCVPIRLPPTQVVQMRDRDLRQPCEPRFAKYQEGAFHQLLGGWARERTVQRVHLGQ